ncbi:hypothetical protein, partial [Streptomyces sp. CRN 30]|uniref:hypothetical protein n=1 Tax=Streptomyces sp. CRN 30 TaxID=3075613 RepID=UPI002A7FFC5D
PGGSGLTGATGGPVAPGHGGGTGSFDVTEALAAGPLGNGTRPGAGTEPRRDDLPFFSDGDTGEQTGAHGPDGRDGRSPFGDADGGPMGPNGTAGPANMGGFEAFGGPAGPTGGPTTGDARLSPPASSPSPLSSSQSPSSAGPDGQHGVAAGSGGLGAPGAPGAHGAPGGPGALRGPAGSGGPGGLGGPTGPTGPGGANSAGLHAVSDAGTGAAPGGTPNTPGIPGIPGIPGTSGAPGAGPGGGLSDDTAVLTPQVQAPEPPGGIAYSAPGNVSGDTLTSGIPFVPSEERTAPFQNGPQTPPARPEPAAPAPKPAPAPTAGKPAKPAKKGRNKLVLLGGAVIVVAGLAYGAGLLMNHSDVPKGTTVLGVDIGGGTRDDAVQKLDAAFDERVNKELKLAVDGDTVALKPDQAGLQFDTQATVDVAAQSDYNPVSVIGSLVGNHRVVDPVMPVDEEKLQAALEQAAGGSGSMTEGTITFKSGKAVAVYPKAGQGIDADKSATAVQEAYRTQVETGTSGTVKVPTTARQPEITKAEVDREMKAFAEPAMSANVVVQTDAAHTIEMSPQNSLWKFLGVTAVDGKLVDKPDLDALKELYGQTFDGVTIARANGKKTAVTPEDVYGALRQALLSKTDRVAVIDTNPS